MGNRVARGNYYRNRTRDWLRLEGYEVEVLERTSRLYLPDPKKPGEKRVIFTKRDIWGADLVARNTEHLVFIQVKTNPGHIAQGVRELSVGPWPENVKRWVCCWRPRAPLKEGPQITAVA